MKVRVSVSKKGYCDAILIQRSKNTTNRFSHPRCMNKWSWTALKIIKPIDTQLFISKRFYSTSNLIHAEQIALGSPVTRISKLELEELVQKHRSLYPIPEEEHGPEFSMDDLEVAYEQVMNSGKQFTLSEVIAPLQSESQKKLQHQLATIPDSVPYYLIDVRQDHEVATTGLIETAIPFPFGIFEEFFHMTADEFEAAYFLPFPTEQSLFILYCHNGSRAMEAFQMLSLRGYRNVRLYHGGAAEWFNLPLQAPKEKQMGQDHKVTTGES